MLAASKALYDGIAPLTCVTSLEESLDCLLPGEEVVVRQPGNRDKLREHWSSGMIPIPHSSRNVMTWRFLLWSPACKGCFQWCRREKRTYVPTTLYFADWFQGETR